MEIVKKFDFKVRLIINLFLDDHITCFQIADDINSR